MADTASAHASQSDSIAVDALEAGVTSTGPYSQEPIAGPSSQQGTRPAVAAAGPEAEEAGDAAANEDLWSSILNSVQSSRGVPTKNIVVLGEPGTGKRTLLTSLAAGSHSSFQFSTSAATGSSQDNPRAALQSQDTADVPAATSPNPGAAAAGEQGSGSGRQELLGLTYGYWDVADEESEDDVLARVGAYTLRSSDPAYSHLLNYAFPATSSETAESSAAAARKMLSSSINGGLSSSSSSGRGLGSSSGTGTSATAVAAANALALQTKPSLAALADSLLLITLDWTQPQRFLDQLRRWLVIIRGVVDLASDSGISRGKGSEGGWSSRWAVLDEMRDGLESSFRSYQEPLSTASKSTVTATGAPSTAADAASDSKPIGSELATGSDPAGTSTAAAVPSLSSMDPSLQLPLAEGALDSESNWGVGIVIVCTKADTMNRLEVEKNFKEEQFDYVQQVLRVICLKYGAALFYVTDHRPATIASLRKYILYRLFERQSTGTASGTLTRRFRLEQKPSTVDRDTVFVPTGWDSYGKIKALRGSEDSFDCVNTRRSWESDVEIEKERRRKITREGVPPDDSSLKELALRQDLLGKDADSTRSAVELFEDIVGDWHARDQPGANGSKVAQPDMQAFLAQHYATLQKDSDTKRTSEITSGLSNEGGDGREEGRSIMGPMAASGFSILPKLETPQGDEEDASASALRSSKARSEKRDRPRVIDTDSLNVPSARDRSRPSSPSTGSSSSANMPKQSEVLQSFFQSLLKDKPSSSPGGKGARASAQRKTSASGTSSQTSPT